MPGRIYGALPSRGGESQVLVVLTLALRQATSHLPELRRYFVAYSALLRLEALK